MKEKELREAAICGICGDPIGKSGLPMFLRVTVKRYGLEHAALQRQQGLTMMLGGEAALASVMGPDQDLATLLDERTITVCEAKCAQTHPLFYEVLLGGDDEDDGDENEKAPA